LGRALAASHSAADLTRQLLAFSRQEVLTRKSLDLGHQVSQRMKMIRRLIGEDIELKIDTGLEALMVNGDLGALDQVVMNLCLNARDAMPHGGALSISTIKVFPTDTQLKSLGKTAGLPYALLIVSDTGVGMKPEVQERIFEPFFTTKGPERGTGLGLSTVYGIVRKHGGWIEVESSLGKGSKFRVFLPLIQEERRPESLQAPTEDWDRIATETILIGEDDMGVRLLTKEILESKGYRVLDAGDGAETLEVFKAHRNEIDMVLLDMVMPKISGRDVYEEIRAASPSVPVVFSTGYTNQMVDTEYLETHKLTLMQKPYSPSQLFRTIREVLAK
ncbi:MAG: response regulator, partial [Deltaproteobacteria bacterium]|nr:response regulator [Deltaproteobacteria bacterium]